MHVHVINGNLTISDTVITNNHAVSGGGGAFIFAYNENITIKNVTFSILTKIQQVSNINKSRDIES